MLKKIALFLLDLLGLRHFRRESGWSAKEFPEKGTGQGVPVMKPVEEMALTERPVKFIVHEDKGVTVANPNGIQKVTFTT